VRHFHCRCKIVADPSDETEFEWRVNSTGRSNAAAAARGGNKAVNGGGGDQDELRGEIVRRGSNMVMAVVQYTPKVYCFAIIITHKA
jgi:hypothetical protein